MCSDSDIKSHNICVKTDDNIKLNSYKAAAAYMKANPKYTEEDIEKMYCYPDGKNRRQLSQSTNFQGAPKEEMKKASIFPRAGCSGRRGRGWTS